MTQELYRKEAVAHRHRSLYGEIILRSGPKTWLVTVLLIIVFFVFSAALFLLEIQTDTGHISLFHWLRNQVST